MSTKITYCPGDGVCVSDINLLLLKFPTWNSQRTIIFTHLLPLSSLVIGYTETQKNSTTVKTASQKKPLVNQVCFKVHLISTCIQQNLLLTVQGFPVVCNVI